jgi:hypothetical protein
MDDYKPPAYRLLLSKRNLAPSNLIQPYDPASDKGPLRLRDGNWYWNASYTSEFMIEEDLLLERSTGLNFVQHNERYCRTFGSDCEDRRRNPPFQKTGGRMLSYVLGHELHVLDRHLKPQGLEDRYNLLDSAFTGLWLELTKKTTFGGALKSPDSYESVVLGALALYGMDQVEQAQNLLSLIASKDSFEQVLTEIVRKHFGAPKWKPDW